jgi:sulfite reductase (NADPH) hemoprotein beta-component
MRAVDKLRNMYQYDAIDQTLVNERVTQFRDQTARFLRGELSEDDYRPLRLQNGLYVQKHAPMLRIAVPYGLLSSPQLSQLADLSERYDRGYAHLTTRQNIQFNWPELARVPDLLAELATVQMHAIQTSGNCIRNTTTDQFAGVAPDEIINPLVWAELIRQWSTFHPEFAYLPRKFKIAISGAAEDRAAIQVHDIGLQVVKSEDGTVGFQVFVGGGLGRTPVIGSLIAPFVPWQHLLTYLEAVLRVYNQGGRRDNKYKARIKILVKDTKPEVFAREVDEEWVHLKDGPGTIDQAQLDRVSQRFGRPNYLKLPATNAYITLLRDTSKAFHRWMTRNVSEHQVAGYAAVSVSVKRPGIPPGDLSAQEMRTIADLARQYSFGELRITHEQNIVLADVEIAHLHDLWQSLRGANLATPNIGLLTNIICCPGGDFCSLANAVSIPVAEAITERFDDINTLFDIGNLDMNISGCINACGHHHVGHIGILGVDKNGEEWYQITVGGRQGNSAAIGKILGRSVARNEVADVVEQLIQTYLQLRSSSAEQFVDTVSRLGLEPFKEAVYANA